MVDIFYTKISSSFQEQHFDSYLKTVPKEMQAKIKRYHKWEDQQATLLGKLLVRKGFEKLNRTEDPLAALQYSKHNRPFISGPIDFNISHSGDYVICALSDQLHLGIDIEKTKTVDPSHFKSQMTPEEWHTIATAPNQTDAFFTYWTQKEAVIKADGKGLSIPLDSFMITAHSTTIENTTWHTVSIPVQSDHYCYLATNQKISINDITVLPISL